MHKIKIAIILAIIISSCSSRRELVYFNDFNDNNFAKVDHYSFNKIEIGDILKIEIQTDIPEAAVPYNNFADKSLANNLDVLKINGYAVNKNMCINYPILGEINVENLSENQLALKIKNLLINGGHLKNPHVKLRRINSKFTVLGEVNQPGTFSFYDQNLNIFQALGYAGDLTITGKRDNIKLIREGNGIRKLYNVSLSNSELLNQPYYLIKNNDVIIIEPNFSKVKSAGFIGSPSSIASISSLLLSITLLIINK